MSTRETSVALFVAAVAIAARVAFLFDFAQSPLFAPVEGGHDRTLYHRAAQGPVFPVGAFEYLPLYPLALKLVYAAAGPDLRAAAAFGIACDAITTWLIVLLALRIGARPIIAGMSGLLYALYPLAVVYANLTMPNTLNALLLAAFAFLGTAADRERLRTSAGLGLLAGIAALGWAAWLMLAPTWIAADIARGPDRKRRAAHALLFATAFALPLIPIALHNTRAEGRFVLLTTHGGFNLYMGNHERATGHPVRVRDFRMTATAMLEDAHRAAEQAEGRALSRAESSAWWSRQARAYWRAHPIDALRLTARKALLFWHRTDVDDLRMVEQARLLVGWFDSPLWPRFALIGWCGLVGVLRAPRAGPLRALALAGMASLVLMFITARYRLTLAPVLLTLGAAGVNALIADIRARQYARSAGLAMLAALPVVWPITLRDLRATDYYNAAIQLMQAGRVTDALKTAEAGLAIDPRSAALQFARGTALYQQENYAEAAAAFANCLQLDPAHPQAAYNRALSLARIGDLRAARDTLQQAAAVRPLNENARQLLDELSTLISE